MFQRILVPLDGSEQAERAISVAARLARVSGGSLVFVRVVLPPVDLGKYAAPHRQVWERAFYENNRSEAGSYLANMLLNYSDDLRGLRTDIGVVTGLVAPAIFSVAQRERADLIVLCSRNETSMERWMFGSTTQDAIHHSPVPVLALHSCTREILMPGPTHPLHILAALDGSPRAEMALQSTMQFIEAVAKAGEVALHLVRVIEPAKDESEQERAENYLAKMAEQLCLDNDLPSTVSITTVVTEDRDIPRAIAQTARDIERGERLGARILLVMASHERGKLRRLLGGSVTEHLLHSTTLPLLVIHTATRAATRVEDSVQGRI